MLQPLRNFSTAIREAKEAAIVVLAVMLIVLAVWGSFVWPWLIGLSLGQIIFISLAALCFLLIIALVIWRWFDRRAIQKIPNILIQLDRITLDLIDGWGTNIEVPQEAMDELAEIYECKNEINQLRRRMNDSKDVKSAINKIASRYAGKVKRDEALRGLSRAGVVLDEYGIGLESLRKQMPQYGKLLHNARELQYRIPSAAIGIAIGDYFRTGDGLYTVLLGNKAIMQGVPGTKELLPVKINAEAKLMRRDVEDQTELLILKVREEIAKAQKKSNRDGD